MSDSHLKLSILITTIDVWIETVISKMIWQFSWVYEVIVSHQITDGQWIQHDYAWPDNVKYVYKHSTWLSRNRNHALSHATGDICYICDDDISMKSDFIGIIQSAYFHSPQADIITFEAANEIWKKRFDLRWWNHNFISFLKISSIWITFQREAIVNKSIYFNEKFGLGSRYPIWEEVLFLQECYKKWCKMIHNESIIVEHPDDSTGRQYTDKLAESRIMLWKKLFWWFWWVFACVYFWVFHYKLYSKTLWTKKTLVIFFSTLFSKED